MRVQAYTAYSGTIQITAATPRPEAAPSTHFTAASVHEDYCAQVRSILREYKHAGATSIAFADNQRLQTYLPGGTAAPYYALRELVPAGAPRDIDSEFQLEITRIRYQFMLVILPAAFGANEIDAEAVERWMAAGIRSLFQANSIPYVFIPGDSGERPHQTEIDIICELGPASMRTGVDIPSP